MITIPPPPVEVPPFSGDAAGVTGYGDGVRTASATFDDVGSWISGSSKPDGWTGDAADAYSRSTEQPGTDAAAASVALRKVWQATEDYATALKALKERWTDLGHQRGVLDSDRADLVAAVDAATAATPAQIAELQDRARVLDTDIHGFSKDVSTYVEDTTRADAEMMTAFEGASSLAKARSSFEAGGGTDPADLAAAHLAVMRALGATPEQINAWWDGLTEEQQQALIAAHPNLIGNADGIPAGARDEANRTLLAQDLAILRLREADGTLTDEEAEALVNAEAAEEALANLTGPNAVDPVTGEPVQTQLYSYDPHAFGGDGKVAIAVGDLDTADNVSVQVPGLGTDAGSIGTHAERAFNVYSASRFADPNASTASLAWIGYDAPDNTPWGEGGLDALEVLGEGSATEGGEELADDLDGLRASADGRSHLTLIGHSYGSTTAGHAATDHDIDVDDIVFLGSPGVGGDADHASDLDVDEGHVWAGLNSRDVVGQLGNHGSVHGETLFGAGLGDDPAEDDFGAHRFQAESTTRNEHVNNTADHSKYYDPDTESLYNISQIVTGEYEDVQEADHVYDPWYNDPQDPERDREPTAPSTTGP